jgi:hypothetical protein
MFLFCYNYSNLRHSQADTIRSPPNDSDVWGGAGLLEREGIRVVQKQLRQKLIASQIRTPRELECHGNKK